MSLTGLRGVWTLAASVLTALTVLAAPAAMAQTEVGRSVVDGRNVILYSNNTWRFDETAALPGECVLVRAPVAFCGDNDRWSLLPAAPSPLISAMYQLDDRTYSMLVVEGVGSNDGITLDNLRGAILANFAGITGTPLENVPVLDQFDDTLDGKVAETMAYSGIVEGLNFVYLNTMHVTDRAAIQVITYVIGDEYTESHQAAHDEFVGLIDLTN